MKSCLDPDTLLSVGQALDWNVGQLSHVHACEECRHQLEQLATMHADLSSEEDVRPGFSSDVMAAVADRVATNAAAMEWVTWLNPVLAAFAAVAVAWAARPAPWALAFAGLAAATVTWFSTRLDAEQVH